jgi:hypothetical protein
VFFPSDVLEFVQATVDIYSKNYTDVMRSVLGNVADSESRVLVNRPFLRYGFALEGRHSAAAVIRGETYRQQFDKRRFTSTVGPNNSDTANKFIVRWIFATERDNVPRQRQCTADVVQTRLLSAGVRESTV